MNNYYDAYGRLHNQPVTQADPYPCNNAWIYTAYANKVGLVEINNDRILECWKACHIMRSNLNPLLLRNPGDAEPPFSRDELLGMRFLMNTSRMSNYEDFYGWNFSPYPIPKLSISKLITQALALLIIQPYYKRILGIDVKLWHIELAHRNFFWANKLDQIYRFAFSVPLQDRYSILKWSGRFKYYLPSHLLYASISLIDRIGKPSGIRYLKYGGEANLKAMIKEFPADHDIRVKVGL